jgi:hypothetical protein
LAMPPHLTTVAVVLLHLIFSCEVVSAVTCQIGQWCWQQGWVKQYYVSATPSMSLGNANVICTGVNGSVVDAVSALGAVVPAGNTVWTSLNISSTDTPLSLYNATLQTTQWDACWAANTCCFALLAGTGFIAGVGCTGTVSRLVICQKDGAPAVWSTISAQFQSEFEYGYFSWLGDFDEATATCRAHGGSVATLPAPPSMVLGGIASLLPLPFTPFWVGFRVGNAAPGYWNGSTISFTPPTPFATTNKCSRVTSTTGVWAVDAVDCTTSLPFLCQRLKESASQFCTVAAAPSVLQYSVSAAAGSLRGYRASAAIQFCARRNGAVTKYSPAVVGALRSCFGQPSDLLGTIFGNGIWLDSSTAAVPSFFAPVVSASCTYFNLSTPSAGSADCSTPLPLVCEYTSTPALQAPSSITLGASCKVAIFSTLTTPARTSIQYSYTSAQLGSGTTFVFPAFSTVSSTAFVIGPFNIAQSASVAFQCNDTSSAACAQTNTMVPITATGIASFLVLAADNTNVTTPIDPRTPAPTIQQGWFGAPLTLDALVLPSSAPAANISVSFALIAEVDASLCSVRPATAILSGSMASVRPVVHCVGGSNATQFRIAITTSSNRFDGCQIVDYAATDVYRVTMKRFLYVADNSVATTATYTLLNSNPTVTYTLSHIPSGYLGPTWVCLTPQSTNVSSISLSTFGGTACLSSSSATNSLILTFNMGTVTASAVRVMLMLSGPSATAYDTSRSALIVDITLGLIPITFISPIYEQAVGYAYLSTAFTLQASITTAFPSGTSLTIESTLDSVIVGVSTARFLYFAFAAGSTVTNVSTTTPNDLTGLRDARLFTPMRLMGAAAPFFYLNTTAQPFRVYGPSTLDIYPYIPKYLFVGQALPITISIPATNPLRADVFAYTLACSNPAVCTNIGLVINPTAITFSGGNPVSRTITLTAGASAASSIALVWSINATYPRYTTLSNFAVDVRPRLAATISPFPTKACYFDSINYTLRVVASSSAPQAYALFSLSSASISMVAAANLSTVGQVAYMTAAIQPLPSTTTSVTSSVQVSGPDLQAFALSSPSVTLSPYKPRIQVTVLGMQQFLVAQSTTGTVLTVALDRPPVVSTNVTVRLVSWNSLVTISPSLLVWQLGDNSTRQATITTCQSAACANSNHYVTLTTSAIQDDGTNTLEVKKELNVYVTDVNSIIGLVTTNATGIISLPVIAISSVAFQVANPVPLRINEALPFTIAVGTLPFLGVLNLSIAASAFVVMTPPFVVFTGSSPSTTVTAAFTGVSSQKREIIRVVVGGTASVFFSTPVQMCSFVDATLGLQLTPTNLVVGRQYLIATQSPAKFAVSIPVPAAQDCDPSVANLPRQLPTATHALALSVEALYDGYASVGATLQPSTFVWTSDSLTALSQFLTVTPTGLTLEPSITIVGTVFGNASSYVGFSIPLQILSPANITVLFQTSKVFPKEAAFINITLDRRVTVTTDQLVATLQISDTNCTSVSVQVASVAFTASDSGVTAALQFQPAEATLIARCYVDVSVELSGSALAEFNIPEVLNATVTFVPRRRVTFSLPKHTFDRTFFEINVTLEEAPDAGQTVRFQSTLGLGTSPTWSSSTLVTQSISIVPPYLLPGNNTIPITLIGSSVFEQNRYEEVPPLVVQTLTKLTLGLIGAPIRYYQVIGEENYQTVSFTLSRAPLVESDVVAAVQLTSVVNSLLVFTPQQFRWSSNDSSLVRSMRIVGNALGSAQGLQFVFSSNFSLELGTPDASSVILPSNMTIVEHYRLLASTLSSVMYVNTVNMQVLNITLDVPSFATVSRPLVVNIVFSLAGALNITPAQITFSDSAKGPQSKLVSVSGINPGFGSLSLEPLFTAETSTVVPGFDTMEIRPLIRFDMVFNGMTLPTASNQTASVSNNNINTFTLSMSSFAANVTARVLILSVYSLDGSHELPTYTQNGSLALGDDIAVLISPYEFAFNTANVASLTRAFTVSCFAKAGARVVLSVSWNDTTLARVFSAPYTTVLSLPSDWSLQLGAFPSGVYDGVLNAVTFSVVLIDVSTSRAANASVIASSPRGSVSVAMAPRANCAGIITLSPQRALLWTEALSSSPMVVMNSTVNSSRSVSCDIDFYMVSPLTPLFSQLEPTVNVSRRLLMVSSRTEPRASPLLRGVMQYVVTTNTLRVNDQRFTINVMNSSFRNCTNASLCTNYMSPVVLFGQDSSVQGTYAVVVSTDASIDDEPAGFMSADVIGSAGPLSIVFVNDTQIVVVLRSLPGLTLISDRTLRVQFMDRVFSPSAYPSTNASVALTITVTKYVSDIVTPAIRRGVGIASTASLLLAGFAAPSVSMLLFQPNLILLAFQCPNPVWQEDVFPFGSIQDVNDEALDQWMTVAASSAAVVGVVVGLHFIVVFIVHVVKKGRFNKVIEQKYSKVTNRFTVTAAVLHFPTAPCVFIFYAAMPVVWYCGVTLINSATAGFRVISLLIMIVFVLVYPFLVHGVVWRSFSLEFIPYKTFHSLLGPSGFWWHEENATYLPRYWVLVQETRRNTRWYLLAQYIGLVLVSLVLAVNPSTKAGCTVRAAVVTSLFGIGLVSLAFLRPFRIAIMNYLYIISFAAQFAAWVVLTRVSTDSIQQTALLNLALGLVYMHVAFLLLLPQVGVFCRFFAKPGSKSEARIAYRVEQKRKNRRTLEDADFGGLDRTEGLLDEGEELLQTDDDEEELHPGHPLYDREELPSKPQAGQFRRGAKGFITGAEAAFSPSRKKELVFRSQLHNELLDETIDAEGQGEGHLRDAALAEDSLDATRSALLLEQEDEWSVERELEGLPPLRTVSVRRDTAPQFPSASVRPSRLQIVEL